MYVVISSPPPTLKKKKYNVEVCFLLLSEPHGLKGWMSGGSIMR